MTLPERQFFALLRSGLWNEVPDPSLFTGGADWNVIYRIAFEQTVVGHITDGINRLPQDLMPPVEALDPFLGDVLATEKRNHQLDHFIPKLVEALEGIPVLLIKGQGIALDYLEPARRQPGDIDLLLMPESYPEARRILLGRATQALEEAPAICHQGMMFHSIEVELHGTISTLMSRRLDRKLADLQADLFRRGRFLRVPLGGKDIPVPDADFNAVYIFVHFLHHYWSGGVGLRQIIDWMTYVSVHKREIDLVLLRGWIESLGLLHVWQVFSGFVMDYLGCPPEKLPFGAQSRPSAEARLWREIRTSGNFGKNTCRSRGAETWLVRKSRSFWRNVVQDRLRHFRVFPRESVRFFFGAFGYGLERLSKGE